MLLKFKKHTLIIIGLSLLLVIDLVFSFIQYFNSPIDGDFAPIVLGAPPYDRVLVDPFGMGVLQGESYAATNRFSAHMAMVSYFRHVPFWLQLFLDPIESIYASAAIAKLLIHILLVGILAYMACTWLGVTLKRWLVAALLISPFFQYAGGHMYYMAVIDQAITYAMFYALPVALLLIYFLPFFHYFKKGKLSRSPFFIVGWILFALVMVFFGPLPAPILIISATLILGYATFKNFVLERDHDFLARVRLAFVSVPLALRIMFIAAFLLGIYSLSIGTKNTENLWDPLPMEERYSLLIKGFYEAFLNPSSGYFVLLVAIASNISFLYIFYRRENKTWIKLTVFLGLFSLLYLLLLPLGGYRWYRPLILRRDTLLPLLIILLYLWGSSSLILLNCLKRQKKYIYILGLLALSITYILKDRHLGPSNQCERKMIKTLASANRDCVMLPQECWVLQWSFNTDCAQTQNQAVLLHYYQATPKVTRWHFSAE